MKPIVALRMLMALTLVGQSVGQKNKSKNYQMGAFISSETVADGTIANTMHGDGTTVAGGVYSNQVSLYTIKVADGRWRLERRDEAVDTSMRNMGVTPAHWRKEKKDPLDFLKNGDRVLFRVEVRRKLLRSETDVLVPFAENPDKEFVFVGTFVPDVVPPTPQKLTDNVKAMCDAHKLSTDLEKEYCSAPAPGTTSSPQVAPVPTAAPDLAAPVAQPTTTAPTPQDPKMAEFKRMCDSGMFTKGVYAKQPFFQQQCDLAFPKEPTKQGTPPPGR